MMDMEDVCNTYKPRVHLCFHSFSLVSKATAAVHRLRPADGDRQPQQDAGTNEREHER